MALDTKHPPVRTNNTQEAAPPHRRRSAWEVGAWICITTSAVATVVFIVLVLTTGDESGPRTILTGQSARAVEGPIEAELGPVLHAPPGTSVRAVEGPIDAYPGRGAGVPKGMSVRGIEGAIDETAPSGPPTGTSVRALDGPNAAASR